MGGASHLRTLPYVHREKNLRNLRLRRRRQAHPVESPPLQSRQMVTTTPHISTAKPFVKWAGGKRSVLKELLARVPEKFNNYHEPFVGGGALFWSIPRNGRAYLSDING